MGYGRIGIVLGLLVFGVGCTSTHAPTAAWITDNGGPLGGSPKQRAYQTLQRLALGGQEVPASVTIDVLNSETPTAYSWRNGNIYVTLGLLQLLDDDELAAAIAHELGHLVPDRGRQRFSLQGSAHAVSAEIRADQVGMDWLRRSGIPEGAMITMLTKVAGAQSQPARTAQNLRERAHIANTRLASSSR